jgi:hypothetical protein
MRFETFWGVVEACICSPDPLESVGRYVIIAGYLQRHFRPTQADLG